MRFTVLLLAAITLGACHGYVEVETGVPTRGSVVRAHLQPPAPVSIGEVSIEQTASVTGEVVSWEDDALIVSARTLLSAAGQDYLGDGYTVTLPRRAIAGIEERRLSVWRTALLTTGILVGSVVLGLAAREGFGSAGGEPGGGLPR